MEPTDQIPVVRRSPETGDREMVRMRWGLIPGFLAHPEEVPELVHVRAETADSHELFRAAFRDRRCLLVTDGFTVRDDEDRTYRVRRREGGILAAAGIWEIWRPEGGERVESCAMITVPANDLVARFQARMPALLDPEEYGRWLDPDADPAEVKTLLEPYPSEPLRVETAGR